VLLKTHADAPDGPDEPDELVLARLLEGVEKDTAAELVDNRVTNRPGHVVLPMTVAVDGSAAPSFTAFKPVSQLQSWSPGQQYQSCGPSHFPRGIDSLESIRFALANGLNPLCRQSLLCAMQNPGHSWLPQLLSVHVPR